MADNLSSRVRTITLTATASLTSGTFCEESGWMGIPMASASSGDEVALAVEGSFWATLAGTTIGDLVYWTGSALTLTSGGNKCVGKVLTATQTSGRHNGESEIELLLLQGAVVG